jgi:hypothetical protein
MVLRVAFMEYVTRNKFSKAKFELPDRIHPDVPDGFCHIVESYRLGADGRPRHFVVYSIVDSEWAAVKAHLQELLDCPR